MAKSTANKSVVISRNVWEPYLERQNERPI